MLLVADHGVNVDIFDTAEILLSTNGFTFSVLISSLISTRFERFSLVIAGRAGIGKLAGTLDEMQTVIISPRLDIILAHQIQRADQLHALEVDAVKLRHHRLHLRTVEHSHEDRLDDIIVMMAECNLVAAELLSQNGTDDRVAFSRRDSTANFPHGIRNQKYRFQKS